MRHIKLWLTTSRPKTLLLIIAPIILGAAFAKHHFNWFWFFVTLLSAVCIQVGTNFANDYFDHHKGADTTERLGPKRALQQGLVTHEQMRVAYWIAFIIAALFGCLLVYRTGWPIILIGIASIASGIMYTATRYSLAYLGIAEIFVIMFFGPVATLGTYYVQTLSWNWAVCFAGLAPGCIATALLVVNNLRDYDQDKKANKKTLAVRFGKSFAKYEYTALLFAGLLVPLFLHLFFGYSSLILLSLVLILLAYKLIRHLYTYQHPSELNTLLANTGKFALLFCVVIGLTL